MQVIVKQIKSFICGLTVSALLAPSVVLAAPRTLEDIVLLITRWQIWITRVFWIVAVVFIVWAAFKFLTSGGDEKKVGAAKNALIWAFMAIGVALLSAVAQPLVTDLLKVR